MFEVNQQVVHCRDGVATITSITSMAGNDYFVLKAKRGEGVNIFVPLSRAESIIRPIMSKEEADELITYMKNLQIEFNSNTKQRRDDFKRRIQSGDIKDIIFLNKELYLYQTASELPPKVKFGQVDFDILEKARITLFDEFMLVYNVEYDEVSTLIDNKMESL